MDLRQVTIPPDAIVAFAMHCGANGHSKDWIGCFTQGNLILSWWGKKGQHYQSAAKGGLKTAFDKLVQEKIGKGYVHVDSWSPLGWDSEVQKQNAATKAALNSMKQNGSPPVKPEIKTKPVNIVKGIKAPAISPGWDF